MRSPGTQDGDRKSDQTERGEMPACCYFVAAVNGSFLGRMFSCLFLFVLLISVIGVSRAGASKRNDPAVQPVPSSPRSLRVISSIEPSLVRDLEGKGFAYGTPLFIRVFKEERELEVWLERDGKFSLFRTYPVAAVSGWLGPKRWEGDLQAPEGFYSVTPCRMNPNSLFHLSFDIGYPNDYDRSQERTGSALMIHGSNTSLGCFAMTDELIEEIYALADAALRNGQDSFQVHSFPFRMTDENMERHRNSRWYYFWTNLRVGYDLFEAAKLPPDVSVASGEYVFSN